jgi:hypothetical protein
VGTTLQLAGALVAVVASGIGVIVALDQLTLRARLRRTETWARESAAVEADTHRKVALEALRLRSVAGVVGSHAVPLRFFATTAVTPAVAVALLVGAFRRGEDVFPDLAALLFVSLVGCGIEFRRAVRFYLERRQVVNAYVAGGREVPGPRLDLMNTIEGGTRGEFLAALGLSAGLNGALVGAGLLYRNGQATFGPVAVLAGGGLAWVAFSWVRARGRVV